jgi:D-tyrosyl-tRNA(Tyr) deacylase
VEAKTKVRALIQRVASASVTVDSVVVGQIEKGLLILLGVGQGDGIEEVKLLSEKVANLRIFSDADGKFNLSLLDVQGQALVVSQFTLYADTRKGRRPSFINAAHPELAAPLVDRFADLLRGMGITVAQGRFGADMKVALLNDGPVTIMLDSDDLRQPRRSA